MVCRAVVFLALLSVALAGIGQGPHQPKPDKFKNVEGCYVKDLDAVIPTGQSAPCKQHCMEYRCGRDYLGIVTCASVDVLPPCWLEEDHSKPYPQCCPTRKCP